MSTPPLFPQLAGQGWSVHKRPTFSTRVASHVSGREVRAPLYAGTLYEFELTFDALASNVVASGALAGVGSASLQTLLGFYLQCQGQLFPFLYIDPTDNVVRGQLIGTGDGSTMVFPLRRTLGTFTEPVSYATLLNAVYVNGLAQPSVSLMTPNSVSLPTAPAAGTAITADFAYAFLCRFSDDQQDFENVMNGLWTVSSLKFRSIRA